MPYCIHMNILCADLCCWWSIYIYIAYAWRTYYLFSWQLFSMVWWRNFGTYL